MSMWCVTFSASRGEGPGVGHHGPEQFDAFLFGWNGVSRGPEPTRFGFTISTEICCRSRRLPTRATSMERKAGPFSCGKKSSSAGGPVGVHLDARCEAACARRLLADVFHVRVAGGCEATRVPHHRRV